jgi:2-hydroxychromene-2-carboxylate isomerase
MTMETTWLDAMTDGKPHDFYGVDNHAFNLDGAAFEALEDEDDGYRSYLDTVELSQSKGLIFFKTPIAKVIVTTIDPADFWGYIFTDVEDGHVWLKVGTEYAEEHYPMFIFDYQPKTDGGTSGVKQ